MKKKAKKVKVKKNARRIVVFGFFSVAIIVVVLLSVFKIVAQIIDKYQEAAELEIKMAKLEEKEEDLNKEILKLQDKDYLARYAREKYFYSKDGELIIRIPSSNKIE